MRLRTPLPLPPPTSYGQDPFSAAAPAARSVSYAPSLYRQGRSVWACFLDSVCPGALVPCCSVPSKYPDLPATRQGCGRFVFAELHLVELVQTGLVEPLIDAVGLRTTGFCPRVLYFVESEKELVRVSVVAAAVLGASIGQNAQYAVVQAVYGGDRRPGVIELAECNRGERICATFGVCPLDIIEVLP